MLFHQPQIDDLNQKISELKDIQKEILETNKVDKFEDLIDNDSITLYDECQGHIDEFLTAISLFTKASNKINNIIK